MTHLSDNQWPSMRISRGLALERSSNFYAAEQSLEEIENWQLRRLNEVWRFCISRREFYKYWKARHDLPDKITTLDDLRSFPVLTKGELSEHKQLVFHESDRRKTYTTGGSTSEPTSFPRSSKEDSDRYAANYVGRGWWGISPTDSRALIWGHSHLLGGGLGGEKRRLIQSAKDRLTHTLRLDGYRTDRHAYEGYIETILASRPSHLVGYASALLRLANVVTPANRDRVHDLRLKGIIATADTLVDSDLEILEHAFGCPIIVEYGAAETGVIAISRPDRSVQVLWGQQLLLADRDEGVLWTSLSARQFPLINYSLGDVVTVEQQTDGGSLMSLRGIQGRANDLVSLGEIESRRTRQVWAVHLTHIIKSAGGVQAIQYGQSIDGTVQVFVELTGGTSSDVLLANVLPTLRAELPWADLSRLRWDFESPHEKSRSGKHLVLRRNA